MLPLSGSWRRRIVAGRPRLSARGADSRPGCEMWKRWARFGGAPAAFVKRTVTIGVRRTEGGVISAAGIASSPSPSPSPALRPSAHGRVGRAHIVTAAERSCSPIRGDHGRCSGVSRRIMSTAVCLLRCEAHPPGDLTEARYVAGDRCPGLLRRTPGWHQSERRQFRSRFGIAE